MAMDEHGEDWVASELRGDVAAIHRPLASYERNIPFIHLVEDVIRLQSKGVG